MLDNAASVAGPSGRWAQTELLPAAQPRVISNATRSPVNRVMTWIPLTRNVCGGIGITKIFAGHVGKNVHSFIDCCIVRFELNATGLSGGSLRS